MSIACPNCNSRNLRYSRVRKWSERLASLVGIRPLRCRDCGQRFVDRTWSVSGLRYARCPNCWRMDLSLWAEKDFHTSAWMKFRLRLGGKPFRCEYCRINFVSFRLRHERFSFKRWQKLKKRAEQNAAE